MSDQPLASGTDAPAETGVEETSPPAPARVPLLPVALAGAAIVLLVAAGGWWYFAGRASPPPDWERLPGLDLAAPAGDAFLEETPWAHLLLTPARPEAENTLRIRLEAPRGTPVPGAATSPRITEITAQPLAADAAAQTLALTPAEDGALAAAPRFDRSGWWRLRVTVAGAELPADFYLLLPDPNVNGPGAVSTGAATADGEALFQRGAGGIAALRTVRYTQWLGDGRGNASVAEHAVSAGGEGAPAAFTFRITGGMEAVVIGETRWIRLPGDLGWQRQTSSPAIPPAEWLDEYAGATGFTILGEEMVDGERCQILAFVVPELTEPRRQTVAWYVWWVGAESGHVRREAMVSRLHYMLNGFRDFDAPLEIAPPEGAATPFAATPAT